MRVRVHCASCLREVEDEGKSSTCPYCGTSPVPSYSYGENSPFHPDNCNCALTPAKLVRKRKLPLPTKPNMKLR